MNRHSFRGGSADEPGPQGKRTPDEDHRLRQAGPDTETRIRIAPEGGIVEQDVNWVVSPYDEFAIEEALKIKEKLGEVVLLGLGPDRVQTALRNGLAMGPTRPFMKDPLFDQTDTQGPQDPGRGHQGLAPFDLVLTGQQGVGGDTARCRASSRGSTC
jgi:electron transfer flavoprotein beta subunit